jgi:nicotinamidase/pyrazinamidase
MNKETIFWNTDTQHDFMRNDESFKGALAVPNARTIEPNLKLLTRFARENGYRVINTADWHTFNDREISTTPDFVSTYPMHCQKDTKGAEYVPAASPINAYVIDWADESFDKDRLVKAREVVLYKNEFDIYSGNPHANTVIQVLNPARVIHYGVATNVCVDQAVMGNLKRDLEVIVVSDAMKDLPHLVGTPLETKKVLDRWQKNGVKLVTTKDLLEGSVL